MRDRRGEVGHILRAMHEVNLLGKYIPEFGKLTCLVQHEFYHQYSADEHTLVCLEQLDRIWEAKEEPFKNYAPIFLGLERPGILYLALLLHDVGKAGEHERGQHAAAGASLALRAAKRLQLESGATATLEFLVENHLLMANISQRRDLDDPSVIRNFARQVGTPEKLNLLTLLTFADSQGTSDKLWNGFKDSLLWQLHARAMTLLTGGTEFRRAGEEQQESLRQEVRRLADDRLAESELDAHFSALPARYFQIHLPKEILDDVSLARTVATGNRTVETFYCTVDATDRTANSTDGEAGLFHRTADGAGKCFGMRFNKDFAPDGAGNRAPVVPGRAAAGVVFS